MLRNQQFSPKDYIERLERAERADDDFEYVQEESTQKPRAAPSIEQRISALEAMQQVKGNQWQQAPPSGQAWHLFLKDCIDKLDEMMQLIGKVADVDDKGAALREMRTMAAYLQDRHVSQLKATQQGTSVDNTPRRALYRNRKDDLGQERKLPLLPMSSNGHSNESDVIFVHPRNNATLSQANGTSIVPVDVHERARIQESREGGEGK